MGTPSLGGSWNPSPELRFDPLAIWKVKQFYRNVLELGGLGGLGSGTAGLGLEDFTESVLMLCEIFGSKLRQIPLAC